MKRLCKYTFLLGIICLLLAFYNVILMNVDINAEEINANQSNAGESNAEESNPEQVINLSLLGEKNVKLYIKSEYVEPGITVNPSTLESDIETWITDEAGQVVSFDSSKAGSFTYHYRIKDNSASEITRKVIIQNAVCITDFGAEPITKTGTETSAIHKSIKCMQNAIDYASENKIPVVDFGGEAGIFYAEGLLLKGNISYINTKHATLKAVDDSPLWSKVLYAKKQNNIDLKGIMIDGNAEHVSGNANEGCALIWIADCSNVNIFRCYLHDNKYCAIIVEGTDHANFFLNKIQNTDCGIITVHKASNYLNIYSNDISGGDYSEPISIYNDDSDGNSKENAVHDEKYYSHDINIVNNKCYNKLYGAGIQVSNTHDVLIKGNLISECDTGIYVAPRGEKKDNKSFHIVIEENRTYKNKNQGILVAGKDIDIRNNILENELSYGIHVFTKSEKPSENIMIYDNKIINFNDMRGTGEIPFGTNNKIKLDPNHEAAGIIISGGKQCIIQRNEFVDKREMPLSIWNIQITHTNVGTKDAPVWIDSDHNEIIGDNIMCPHNPQKGKDVFISYGHYNSVDEKYSILKFEN